MNTKIRKTDPIIKNKVDISLDESRIKLNINFLFDLELATMLEMWPFVKQSLASKLISEIYSMNDVSHNEIIENARRSLKLSST